MPFTIKQIAPVLSVGIASIFISINPAYSGSKKCAQRANVIEHLTQKYGESQQSVGVMPNGHAIETYAHIQKGTWTILVTSPNGTSCMLASGNNYVYSPVIAKHGA